MAEGDISFTERIDNSHGAGSVDYIEKTIANGRCPFCNHIVSFIQIGLGRYRAEGTMMIPIICANCNSISTADATENKLFPPPRPDSIDELPEEISKYYDEAIRCMQAEAPNGATTLFRKTIHAIAIYYDICEVDANMNIFKMIDELDEQGYISSKLRDSLFAVKDIGNDGAHINENEPDMQQAVAIKSLIDAVLKSTIKSDQNIEFAREKHPNEFKE
jgi:transcription elongation factor Elf1